MGTPPCIPSASQHQESVTKKGTKSQPLWNQFLVYPKECPFATKLPCRGHRSQRWPCRTHPACGARAWPTPSDPGVLAGSAHGLLGQLQLAGRHRSMHPGTGTGRNHQNGSKCIEIWVLIYGGDGDDGGDDDYYCYVIVHCYCLYYSYGVIIMFVIDYVYVDLRCHVTWTVVELILVFGW